MQERIGPNMKRLAIEKMSRDAIPDGGGIADGLRFLSDVNAIRNGFSEGLKFARQSVTAIRTAADPNPYRNRTDEEIAGVILEEIRKRREGRFPSFQKP
jgi:hypothetical protein